MSSNCQVQTPDEYVIKLLDSVDYNNNLYGKRVLENSCGEGNVLSKIVERYIFDSRKNGYSDIEIVQGIERDIVGYEKEEQAVALCVSKLESIRKQQNLPKVHWKIFVEDYLLESVQKYDFIIGNPPYITYHDLSVSERKWLKNNFTSCQNGRFDYYYAFVEKSINSLNQTGKLAYIIPFSVFRNKSAEIIRTILKVSIAEIHDFTGEQLFTGVITSSVIIICDNNRKAAEIKYYSNSGCMMINKDDLDNKWFFIKAGCNNNRFGDYFRACNSVATLCNEVYLIKSYEQDEHYFYVGESKIEKEILLPAVSVKTLRRVQKTKKEEKIIFPYKIIKQGYERYTEQEIEGKFPEAVKYLEKNKKKLSKRNINLKIRWFEYGRTQALKEIKGEKLILPMVITSSVKTYKVKSMEVPYAGYYVKKVKNGKYSLSVAKKILESKEFYNYVKNYGTPTTATSYRISVKEIEEYKFDIE